MITAVWDFVVWFLETYVGSDNETTWLLIQALVLAGFCAIGAALILGRRRK